MDTSIVVAIIAAIPGALSLIIAFTSGSRLKNKADAAKALVDTAMEIVEELQKECALLKTRIEILESENAMCEVRIGTLEEENKRLRYENKKLRDVIETLRARIKEIESNGKS